MRSLVIACGSGAVAPHAPTLVVNGAALDPNTSGVLVVGGGGGGGWPSSLDADTLFRYDASDLASLTLSGSDVTAWADLGPSARHLTRSHDPVSGYASPTYSAALLGGGPAVAFAQTGSNAHLDSAAASIAYSALTLTLIACYEPRLEARTYGAVVGHLNGSGAGPVLYDSDTQRAQDGGIGAPEPRSRAPISLAPQVVIATIGPSVATIERDGVEVQTVSVVGTLTDIVSRPITVGGDAEWLDQGARYVGCVCVVARALTSEEKTAVYAYCALRGWVS